MTLPTSRGRRRNAYLGVVVVIAALLVAFSFIIGPDLVAKTGIPPSSSQTSTSSATIASTSGVTSNMTRSTPATELSGGHPGTPVFDPVNEDVYVSDLVANGSGSVAVISAASNTEVASVTVGSGPQTPVLDSGNGYVYVPNSGSDTVSIIAPTNSVVGTLNVGTSPMQGVYDTINGDIYVANAGSPDAGNGSVSVISGASNTVIATVAPAPSQRFSPGPPVVNSLSGDVYVSNQASGGLYAISVATNTIISTIAPDDLLGTPVFDSANGDFYATAPAGILVISESSSAVVPFLNASAGSTPAFDSANGDLYFPTGTGISIISGATNAVVANIAIPAFGAGELAFDSFNGDVYVGGGSAAVGTDGAPVVYVIGGANNTVVGTPSVGSPPGQPGVDSIGGNVYVPCPAAGAVYVISGASNTVIATVPVG